MCISRRYILTYIHLGFIKCFASFVLSRESTRLYQSVLMISSSSFNYKISYTGLPVDMCHKAVTKGRCAQIRFNDWEYCKLFFARIEAGIDPTEAYCQPATTHLASADTELCSEFREMDQKQQQGLRCNDNEGAFGGGKARGDHWNKDQ